jgi:ABC-type uncharacterized transport system permease subunit
MGSSSLRSSRPLRLPTSTPSLCGSTNLLSNNIEVAYGYWAALGVTSFQAATGALFFILFSSFHTFSYPSHCCEASKKHRDASLGLRGVGLFFCFVMADGRCGEAAVLQTEGSWCMCCCC